MAMTKRKLDTLGGVGSILCSLVCLWFSTDHHHYESMWKVWIGFACLLALNGIAMVLWAQRPQPKQKPAHAGH